jgi:ABC-2 type transport system permease protein
VIDLFRSEVLRARSRRLVVMVIVGAILLISVAMVIAGWQSHRPTAEQIAASQSHFEKQFKVCMNGNYLGPGQPLPPGYDSLEQYCSEVIQSNADDSSSLIKWRDAGGLIVNSAGFTVLLGVLLGASLGGADWSTGSMPTLLAWEPRRIRVLLVRALVTAILVFIATLGLQAVLGVAFRLAVVLRGSTTATPPGLVGDIVRDALRVSTVAAAFAVIAVALATLGRSTVAAVGVLVGYLVLVEGVIAGFSRGTQDKMLVRAAGVVISHTPLLGFHETVVSQGHGVSVGSSEPYVLLGIGEAWGVVGFYVVVLVVLAGLAFRLRDVN